MSRPNVLLIMSDEHAPQMCGCYGNEILETPNLDRLASQGTLFENAYTNCPICVPARASFMTGRYVHDIEVWDNDAPLSGSIPTIATHLSALGYETVACGRTHFVGEDSYHGFQHRLLDDIPKWKHLGTRRAPNRAPDAQRASRSHVTECGPGENYHVDYDRQATDLAVQFLQEKSGGADAPWLLYCGFINPHFPLVCPEEYFRMYDRADLPLAKTRSEPIESQHPVIRQLRHWQRGTNLVDEEVERTARASYYGLISYVDDLIGDMLSIVDATPLRENTVVIYVSDHGENAGEHGLWQKQCFYEHSVRIPFLLRAPGAPKSRRVIEDVSLVDVVPTILALAYGKTSDTIGVDLPGRDLLPTIYGRESPSGAEGSRGGAVLGGPVFSEYHTMGMEHAGYMVKEGRYKYNYYVGHRPELYDLSADPDELVDVAGDPAYADVRKDLHGKLLDVVDPEAVDRRAKENQARPRHNGPA